MVFLLFLPSIMENYILIFFIPILLTMDLLFLSIAGGVTLQPYKWQVALKISLVFGAVQSIAAIIAILIAHLLEPLISSFAVLTGSILVAFVAIKMLTDARKVKNEDRTYLMEDNQVLGSISLASSFNILLAFLGLGLLGVDFTPSVLVLLITIVFISQFGLFVGSHYRPERIGRFSKFAGGLLILILTIINYFL